MKKGYKETELGVIPVDWEVVPISSFATINTGNKNTEDKIEGGDYPFFVRSQKVERINSYCYDGEAVLTAGDGVGTGKVFHYIYGKFDYHQRVYCISQFQSNIFGFYFYLIFKQLFFERISQMTAKSSVDSVRKEMIAEMLIPIPPLPEQQKIATVLSDTDALIAATENVLAKKRLVKQATLQNLLSGKTRLPGFGGEWESIELGEIVEIKKGELITQKTSKVGNIPVIGGGMKPSYFHDVSNRKANVITVSASGASAGYVGFHTYEIFASDCSTIEPSNKYNINFIFYLIQNYQHVIFKLQTGGAQPHVYPEHLKKLYVNYIKDIDEQTAIAEVLTAIDDELTALEQQLAKYRLLKQGLMQELLSGKTRLV